MFTVREIETGRGILQYRRELLTDIRCRISPERIKRKLNTQEIPRYSDEGCPFCPGKINTSTPTFSDGKRICRGECTTFPNLYPYAELHTVAVITREHTVDRFTRQQLTDALFAITESLQRYDGYTSINWNNLPSAGASIVHPHLQGLGDRTPSWLADRYIVSGHRYLLREGRVYWDDLREREETSERFLFGDEIVWGASPVPIGEREVRGLLPISCIRDLEAYIELLAADILHIIELYRHLGSYAFNASLSFDRAGSDRGYRAFISMISRLNPNGMSTSDSAFMERLHQEPVVLTLPEELARYYHEEKSRL